jgi:hypothetical protein
VAERGGTIEISLRKSSGGLKRLKPPRRQDLKTLSSLGALGVLAVKIFRLEFFQETEG